MRLFGWKPPGLHRPTDPGRAKGGPAPGAPGKPRPVIGDPTHPRRWGLPPIDHPVHPRPFGIPDPNAGSDGPEPVGPNYWLQLRGKDPDQERRISPNYPTRFNYAVGPDGIYGPPSLVTGPSLLAPRFRVPGPVDYDRTPDRLYTPHPGLPGVSAHGDVVGNMFAYLPAGLPPGRDGLPSLPHDARYGARPPAEAPSAANPWGLPGPETVHVASRADGQRRSADEEAPPQATAIDHAPFRAFRAADHEVAGTGVPAPVEVAGARVDACGDGHGVAFAVEIEAGLEGGGMGRRANSPGGGQGREQAEERGRRKAEPHGIPRGGGSPKV